MENVTVIDTRFLQYPGTYIAQAWWIACVKIAAYTLLITASLVGNVLVIIVVWRTKKMQTPTNFYIVNLAVSDLFVTSACTWVYLVDDLTEGWVLGAVFCKANSFVQVMSLVSSILTLTLIACDRFFGIVFAMKAHLTVRRAKVFISLIWISAIAIGSPLLLYREQLTRHWNQYDEIWCADVWPTSSMHTTSISAAVDAQKGHAYRLYYTFLVVVLYFFPVAVMSTAYAVILTKLWCSATPGERLTNEMQHEMMKKKIIIMLFVVLMVFTVCWLPVQIAILYSTHRNQAHNPLPAWYARYEFFANYMAQANSALNPFIYTGFSDNFKKGVKVLLGIHNGRGSSISMRTGPKFTEEMTSRKTSITYRLSVL